jgi:hypothetical protein
MSTRRISILDFKVTIPVNDHLAIDGVWAERIHYFREKSFDLSFRLFNDSDIAAQDIDIAAQSIDIP